MARLKFVVLYILSFVTPISTIPAISNADLDGFGLLPYGGVVSRSTGTHLEIRGVVGGRKKRYIIERAESKKCCRDKPFCRNLLGEIMDKNCKCNSCGIGKVPNLAGTDCTDDCPQGSQKTPDGKGCCPSGQRPTPDSAACELDCGKDRPVNNKCPLKDGEDEEKARKKGKCGDGQILGQRVGGQDTNTPSPQCIPDDQSKCKPGEIPETRKKGDKDPNTNVRCAKPDENNRKKCNAKKQYIHVVVAPDPDGTMKATETCKPTEKFKDRKKNRLEKLKEWKQKKWEVEKPAREAKEKEDKEKKKKEVEEKRRKKEEEQKRREEELRKKKEEEQKKEGEDKRQRERKDKKKAKMGNCLGVVALLEGINFVAPLGKRSVNMLARGEEHPYEWTADYFTQAFVLGDDIDQYWPDDVPDPEDVGVDTEYGRSHG
ncbi:hypothetical protein BDV95DRAFT_615994 [Massariosphaeria phaeospora]|uniref:Uncharacterized protein n=1 Tax=Massariosphaeria phaeospora TaxID=100035 RepID=A0A7C8IF46_9PLEO|nr:hypothetical protein BDV95DRAFT_615994 [Massariosphaeria phaeospora]